MESNVVENLKNEISVLDDEIEQLQAENRFISSYIERWGRN